jgi:hypothetical protein
MLSGISTPNTAPKNPQAASQPSITAAKVWVNDNHTNMCHVSPAVPPCPAGGAGRTAAITAPSSSSLSWASPPARTRPASCAAAT